MFAKLRPLFIGTRRLFSQHKHEIVLRRKPKTKVIEKYEAMPSWLDIKPRDPFDYPLRSLASVREYQRLNPPEFDIQLEHGMVVNEHAKYSHRNRTCWLTCQIDNMKLTPKMQDRMIFLLGDRWKPLKREVRVKIAYYQEFEDNYKKAMEVLRELYFEALRAP